jgi:hypothetical protein
LVHNDDRRALSDADDADKPGAITDDVADAKPELMVPGSPDQANKLGLIGVAMMAICGFRFHASGVEKAQFAERTVLWVADDDMVEHFDFQELPGPDEVARHSEVRFRGRWLSGRVVVLCGAPGYV